MGIVYYGNYAQYLEQGRTEWLRDLGFSYKWMEENDILLPVIELNIKYKQPARYDDLLNVTTTLRKTPTIRIEFDYQIHNQEGVLLVEAFTSLVFKQASTQKLIKAPDYLLEKLIWFPTILSGFFYIDPKHIFEPIFNRFEAIFWDCDFVGTI